MQVHEKFLHYINSSRPLEGKDFNELSNHNGIFKQNFFENPLRQPIIEEFKRSIQTSQGGVFLVSGYRGIGKTTFLNYILNLLKKENPNRFIDETFNLSSISFDLKFEIMCKIIYRLHEKRHQFQPPIQKNISAVYNNLLWERTESREIAGQLKSPSKSKIGEIMLEYKRQRILKQRENVFYLENTLQDLLKSIKTEENKNVVLILEELDKVPFLLTETIFEPSKAQNEESEEINKAKRMDWLLKMLSDIKYFLFESGIIFILVVNKDVFDYWRSQHSEEDLFMNLVTNVLYIPGYFQEELELHHEFLITLNEDIGRFPSFSPYTIKKYFQKCAYYESYANPRLFFQYLSRRMVNNQITVSGNDGEYLSHKVRLYEFNELIYDYFYRRKEINFRHFLTALDELSSIFLRIQSEEKSQASDKPRNNETNLQIDKFFKGYKTAITQQLEFKQHSKNESESVPGLQEFWNIKKSTDERLYIQFENFINIIRENDQIDHFPATNYIIRRLTDFSKIIAERHLVSVTRIIKEMNFQSYELHDIIGQYLIFILIPMNIIVLKKAKVIEIEDNTLYYNFQFDNNITHLHLAYRYELDGDFKKAYENYSKYINSEFDSMDAMSRYLRLLHYMILLGYENPDMDMDKDFIQFEWLNILKRMDLYFIEQKGHNTNYIEMANFKFFQFLYKNYIIRKDKKDVKKEEDNKCEKDNEEFKPKSSFDGENRFYKDPIDYYDKAIEENPMDASLYLWKGCYLYWNRNFVAALNTFKEALQYDNDPLTLIRKGEAYFKLDMLNEAMGSYIEALRFSSCWLHKAFILYNIFLISCSDKNNNIVPRYRSDINDLLIDIYENAELERHKILDTIFSGLNENSSSDKKEVLLTIHKSTLYEQFKDFFETIGLPAKLHSVLRRQRSELIS